MKSKYTKEQVEQAIVGSSNMQEVADKLGLSKRHTLRLKSKFNIIVNFKNEKLSIKKDIEPTKDKYTEYVTTLRQEKIKNENKVLTERLLNDSQKEIIKNVKTLFYNSGKIVTHAIIPDTQIYPGVNTDHLVWAGKECLERRVEVIIFLGDIADFPSLFNKTRSTFSGEEYKRDLLAFKVAMKRFMDVIRSDPTYNPKIIFCLGNHEFRIIKIANEDKALKGLMDISDLGLEEYGIQVVDYLQPIIVDGIVYCHKFTHGKMCNDIQSAKLLAVKKHQSCFMGHVQHCEWHREERADGSCFYAVFAGSFYTHNMDYLSHQGNNYSRQMWFANDVQNGEFDLENFSIKRLEKKWK